MTACHYDPRLLRMTSTQHTRQKGIVYTVCWAPNVKQVWALLSCSDRGHGDSRKQPFQCLFSLSWKHACELFLSSQHSWVAFGRLRGEVVCSNLPLKGVGPQWLDAVQRYKPLGHTHTHTHTHTHPLSLFLEIPSLYFFIMLSLRLTKLKHSHDLNREDG